MYSILQTSTPKLPQPMPPVKHFSSTVEDTDSNYVYIQDRYTDPKKTNPQFQYKTILFKKWMFVSGGCDNKLYIYNLNNSIKTIALPKTYAHHGFVVKSIYNTNVNDTNTNANTNTNTNTGSNQTIINRNSNGNTDDSNFDIIELLLCGGAEKVFFRSFELSIFNCHAVIIIIVITAVNQVVKKYHVT